MLRELIFAFVLVAICVVIHTAGLVAFAEWLSGKRPAIEQGLRMTRLTLLLIVTFAFVIFLHLAGTGIWAGFYYGKGLFHDFETSLYFSLGSYTTIGYGDVVLPQRWRLLGGLEGISGVLLCGLSTAFIFAVVNVLLQIRFQFRSNHNREQ